MGSITVGQAALFAAIACLVLALFGLADNKVLLGESPLLVVRGTTVPSLVWAGFFFSVYRSLSAARISAARIAAWITLVFALLQESLIAYVRFQQAVSYWTPFGSAFNLYGWILRIGWAVFLVAFAVAPKRSATGTIALALAVVTAPMALRTGYNAWNGIVGLLLSGLPSEALWRVLITPGVRVLYWASQVLFLWIFWRDRA